MNTQQRFVLSLICGGVCAALSAAQQPGAAGAAATSSETKSIVEGRVVQDPDGQGVRKVKVSLMGGSSQSPEQYQAVTDDTGNFRFEQVQPGTYLLQLERPGYAPARKAIRGSMIVVTAGRATKDVVFHMVTAGVIIGKIVDLDGDPIQGITLIATPGSSAAAKAYMDRQGNASTNDLGEYRIADLAPGKYLVQAVPAENQAALPAASGKTGPKDRIVYAATYFPGTLDAAQAVAVEVPSGGTATVNFGMQTTRVYRVTGTVVGLSVPAKPQNQADANATLQLAAGEGIGQILLVEKNGQTKQQNVREDGTFEFSDVPAGIYRAQLISISGFSNGEMPSVKMQKFRTPIEVNGSDVLGLQLRAESSGSVSGKFRLEGDEKVDWKELAASLIPIAADEAESMDAMTPMAQAPLNPDGSFDIKDVSSGECQLAVSANSQKFRDYYTKSVLLGGREVVDTGFSVTPGTVLDVVVSAKGAGVEGTVLDSAGKPVAQASVVTMPSSGKRARSDAYQFIQTDEKGHFELRGMNPGEFLVLAFEEMQQDYRSPRFAKKYESKGQKIQLDEGARKNVTLTLITEEQPQ